MELMEQIKKLLHDAKEEMTVGVADREEKLDKMAHDLSMKMEELKAMNSRTGSEPPVAEPAEVASIVRVYGRRDMKTLIHSTKAEEPMLSNLQERSDMIYLLANVKWMVNVHGRRFGEQMSFADTVRSLKMYQDFARDTDHLRKALNTSTSGSGADFIPSEFSADLQDRVRLGLRVAALHRNITMPRSPYSLPVRVAALPMGFKIAERTTDNVLTQANMLPSFTPGTRNVQFNASGIGGLVVFSTEEDEDSIVPILAFARDELVLSIQNALETATINGSRETTHPDNDVAALSTLATDVRTCWNGYRQLSVLPSTDTTADLSTFSETTLRGLRAKMSKYGVNPSELAWVCSSAVYLKQFLELDQTSTLDVFGPSAVVLTGQLGAFDGIPIVVSEFVRDDVHTTGFQTTGETNNKSTINLVHRPSIVYGTVRTLQVMDMQWPLTDQVIVVAKMRQDMQALHNAVTEPLVATGINVTP